MVQPPSKWWQWAVFLSIAETEMRSSLYPLQAIRYYGYPEACAQLPSKVNETPKHFSFSQSIHVSSECQWSIFSLYSQSLASKDCAYIPLTLTSSMEVMGYQGKKSQTLDEVSYQLFSLSSKWLLDKSTLWWAASVPHTSLVKYCPVTNNAHMFSTSFSWSKLCFSHSFEFSKDIYPTKKQSRTKKTANHLHCVPVVHKAYHN